MESIHLKELVKDEKYMHLKNIDASVVEVIILKEEMDMNIKIESSEIIDCNICEDIENMFKDIFSQLKVTIDFNYSCNLNKENLDRYGEKVNKIILDEIPSSRSWIQDIEYRMENTDLQIITPNEMALFSMERNGLMDRLSSIVKKELGLNLSLNTNGYKDKDQDSFLESKDLEALEISKETVKEAKEHAEKIKENGGQKIEVRDDYEIGPAISLPVEAMKDINMESGRTAMEGEVFKIEDREIKGGRILVTLYVSDGTNSLPAKTFLSAKQGAEFLENIRVGDNVRIQGDVSYDNFSRMESMMFKSLKKLRPLKKRMDMAEEKRVELHLHTKMSALDAVSDVDKVIKQAKEWGHKAVAITDHGVVQAFPEAMEVGEELDMKIIYGMEGYLVDDEKGIVKNYDSNKDYNSYIIFDLETTGLSAINDGITEIGAIKVVDGEVVDEYSQLINPEQEISEFITELTGITNDMVKDKPVVKDVIGDFIDFIGDGVLVAHNATFDIGFLREKMKQVNLELNNPILDTLELARATFPNLTNHKLDNLAKHLDVDLENHHRAVDDAKATTEIFLKIQELLKERSINNFDKLNKFGRENASQKGNRPYHVVLLAKNLVGLKNLYKLVSKSHIDYFYQNPRIPKSELEKHREGLIVGSACEAGEVYKAILNRASDDEIRSIVDFYDYLEIQPIANNSFLIERGLAKDEEQLQDINREIYKLGQNYNKPVVATGDVHYIDPEDAIYREILLSVRFGNEELPPLHFKTTDEMLEEFSYLGEEEAYEVVVENTNLINDMVEDIRPIPKGTYPPVIDGSDEELREMSYKKAHEIYGDPLPEIVEKRLERELTSIIDNNYSVMYVIGEKLVTKSIEDGYLVGSRGSVGSSFAATMSGITEVNPLAPHYVCPECKFSEFFTDGSVASGADLPDKDCPECGVEMIKDGQDIPFEVFLGFEGDKEPDIDLNFASEYQPEAHRYTEEIFGKDYVYRAGTIGTLAEKTAYGFVKKYYEEKGEFVNPVETERLLQGCTGVRRSTGQHPGGVMIVPRDKEIFDFTPIQYPANDTESEVITTHFDYDAISSQILKLDILGHDVPTIIKMLEEFTGVDPTKIPLDEEKTMKIFSSTETLGIKKEDINCEVGTLGIPEFGTRFVRQMLVDTKPDKFSELVRISGLSHGTDVWLNNAQELVRNKEATLSEVISTREDIMLTLINAGLDKQQAFLIMEKVRRGNDLEPDDVKAMSQLDLPSWYIDSCNKIKYMFPKAHAAAYVMMSFRIAYFKVYYPEAFYATYFTTKAADFDAELILKGPEVVNNKIKEIEELGNDATPKEGNLLVVLEVVREMYARGYDFAKVDLYKSDSSRFLLTEDMKILPPLMGLDGVGENAAKGIVEARKEADFISIEDLVNRSGITKTAVEALKIHGCLDGMAESNQLDLFSL